jgi:peroxiredoxin
MTRPPEVFGAIVARTPMQAMMVLPFETLWTRARAGSVAAGDPAPDFQLPTLDHQQSVRLSSFRGARPVALVFGSYT